ncbi:hypothetical protein [Microbaculum marinum]|uniref:1,4-alpha-glucan branching enzyme n=1 Tax=Microbaculum marinum TaxID=1764581 RepID=A0AAW9RM48_9HYPH
MNSQSNGSSKTTTDHHVIRRWVEERGGKPAAVSATRTEEDPGILRIDFGEPEEDLEQIEWAEFFEKFEQSNLAFLYQDKTSDGSTSRFFKFVDKASA